MILSILYLLPIITVKCDVLLWLSNDPNRDLILASPSPLDHITDDTLVETIEKIRPVKTITYVLSGDDKIAEIVELKSLVAHFKKTLKTVYLPRSELHFFETLGNEVVNLTTVKPQTLVDVVVRSFREQQTKEPKGRILGVLSYNGYSKNDPANFASNIGNRFELLSSQSESYDAESESIESLEQLGLLEPRVLSKRDVERTEKPEKSKEPTTRPELDYDNGSTGPGFYNVSDKAMLYTSIYPVLRINSNNTQNEYVLKKSTVQTGDFQKQNMLRLIVTFAINDRKVTLRFRFRTTPTGYWKMTTVEVTDPEFHDWMLTTERDISAPIGFSYHCSGQTVFRMESSIELVLFNLQVQPAPIHADRFDDAYDCVNFITVPIWSGIIVTALMCFVLAIALIAISEIKTMDRFDDNKGKPLTLFINAN